MSGLVGFDNASNGNSHERQRRHHEHMLVDDTKTDKTAGSRTSQFGVQCGCSRVKDQSLWSSVWLQQEAAFEGTNLKTSE